MRYKRQANGQVNGSQSKKNPMVVVEVKKEDDVEEAIVEPIEPMAESVKPLVEAADSVKSVESAVESVVVAELSDTPSEVVNSRKSVPANKYNAVVVKNRELKVHVDLLVEERDKLSIQLGSTQDRLISAERESAANSARLERIPRMEADLAAERSSRRDAERTMSASDAKLEQMIRLEADLANERVAHADTKRKYLDSATSQAPTPDELLAEGDSSGALYLGSPVSAGENAKGGIKIAPTYRQSQLSNFVILLLMFVIIILLALVFRYIINV